MCDITKIFSSPIQRLSILCDNPLGKNIIFTVSCKIPGYDNNAYMTLYDRIETNHNITPQELCNN